MQVNEKRLDELLMELAIRRCPDDGSCCRAESCNDCWKIYLQEAEPVGKSPATPMVSDQLFTMRNKPQ